MSAELFSPANPEAAVEHLRQYGHAGLTGFIDPSVLAPALKDARSLITKEKLRVTGENVAQLDTMPDPERQPALHAVLEGIRQGAVVLERDISPSLGDETPQVEVIYMMPGTKGPKHRDGPALADVVALTNLKGSSVFWFEKGDVSYQVNPGTIVLHDLSRRLWHRGIAGPDETRVGLAVAKRKKAQRV